MAICPHCKLDVISFFDGLAGKECKFCANIGETVRIMDFGGNPNHMKLFKYVTTTAEIIDKEYHEGAYRSWMGYKLRMHLDGAEMWWDNPHHLKRIDKPRRRR